MDNKLCRVSIEDADYQQRMSLFIETTEEENKHNLNAHMAMMRFFKKIKQQKKERCNVK